MQGWLMYERAETVRNRAFIDYWLEAAAQRGIALRLVCADELLFGIDQGKPFARLVSGEGQPDFAVSRFKRPLLSAHLQQMGVPVFNNAETCKVLNDKRRTHARFCDIAPMMDTAFIQADTPCPFAYPVVVKAAGGCGGRQVRHCADEAAYRAALHDFDLCAVVQPVCDTPGQDLRIYMLGANPLQAMLRLSPGGDIRANFGIHHQAQPVEAPARELSIACAVAESLQSSLIGVDFIRHRGQWLFNEAEDCVGTRMLYQYTDIDIVPTYLDYILSRL